MTVEFVQQFVHAVFRLEIDFRRRIIRRWIFGAREYLDRRFRRADVELRGDFPCSVELRHCAPLRNARREVCGTADFAFAAVAVKIRHRQNPVDPLNQKRVDNPVHLRGCQSVAVDIEAFAECLLAPRADCRRG